MSGESYPTPPFTSIVSALPPSVPFVAPEALERIHGQRIRLRLGANESAFGVSPRAIDAMRGESARTNWYGDPECFTLRAALAARLAIPIDNILIGNGIDGLLGYVSRAFVEPGVKVLTTLGTYPTFNYHVAAMGGSLHRVAYRQDAIDLQGLSDLAVSQEARLVYLANPDNPSGTWQRSEELEQFILRLPSDCMLLLDEAYHEFAPPESTVSIDVTRPNVVHVRTFSKAHGMAGARIGYAIGHVDVIAAIGRFRNQFEVARVSQAGALASLEDHEFVDGVISQVRAGRDEYHQLARTLGLNSIPSATNFVCIDVGAAQRARDIQDALLREGVFVRVPGAAPLDRCVRVTVGTAAERAEFADIFGAIIRRIPA